MSAWERVHAPAADPARRARQVAADPLSLTSRAKIAACLFASDGFHLNLMAHRMWGEEIAALALPLIDAREAARDHAWRVE